MPYVQRDIAGQVTGRYAVAQPGYAEEWLGGDSPDLIPAPVIPTSVSPLQARKALHQSGLLANVEAAVAAADAGTQMAWEYATSVDRNSAVVQSLSAVLGLSEQQLDDLFILAASLTS